MNKLVSIITPTYNSQDFLKQTIESIKNQTYSNWELLITDDCSTDGTWEWLQQHAKSDSRIKIFQLDKNSGPGIARNHSILNAKGRYIAFCDSDDVWLPNKLELQLSFMNKHDLSFTFSSYQKINENGDKGGIVKAPSFLKYNELLKSCPIGCLTAIYDTQKIGKIYMPEIRKRQDYGLWLKIFRKIESSRGMNETLALYRIRTNSISRNKFSAAAYHFRILRSVAKLPFIKAVYYFIFYAISGLRKFLK